ncbi:MAG TPA: outer membrane protein assembly factor BamE [Methylophilaceae bacterium]|nr:outer membrane protein assembly factor BamE [Methylophilaceae bacterium]
MRILSFLRYPILFLALLCTACGTALPTVKPFKLDVQQGNVVTSKMLLQLRPGMTKSQVRFIMGTPLIQDSFHGNRWDYVYQMRESGKITEQRRVILDFENELLKSVRGDVAPSASDKAATDSAAPNAGPRTINPTPKPQEKGMLDKLKFWKKDEAAPATETKPNESKSGDTKPVEEPKQTLEAFDAPAATESKETAAPAELMPAPQEEVKSILAVPIEGIALPAPTTKAPAAVESAPIESKPATTPAKIEPVKVVPKKVVPTAPKVEEIKPVEKAMEKAIETPKASAATESLPVKTDAKPIVKEVAKPKPVPSPIEPDMSDLPEEGSPTFFDKMLEKIGF